MNKEGKRKEITFTLIAAASLDGRITRGGKEGTGWTSTEDKRWFQKELDRCDALVMGRKTFDVIKRPLTPRNRIVFSHTRLFCYSQEHQNKDGEVVCFSGTRQKFFAILKEYQWNHIAILGGTNIYNWFLKRNLVDEIYLTLEPVIFGAGQPFLATRFAMTSRFRLVSIKRLNPQGTLLLHYKKD